MTAIVVGELSRSVDPAVSEWGNPTEFILSYYIVKMLCILCINSVIIN